MIVIESECQLERFLYERYLKYKLVHLPTNKEVELTVEHDNIELVYENPDEEDKIFYILLQRIVEEMKNEVMK